MRRGWLLVQLNSQDLLANGDSPIRHRAPPLSAGARLGESGPQRADSGDVRAIDHCRPPGAWYATFSATGGAEMTIRPQTSRGEFHRQGTMRSQSASGVTSLRNAIDEDDSTTRMVSHRLADSTSSLRCSCWPSSATGTTIAGEPDRHSRVVEPVSYSIDPLRGPSCNSQSSSNPPSCGFRCGRFSS